MLPTQAPISLPEAAKRLGVCPRTVRRYISEGRLPAYRIGPRLIKVNAADVEAFKQSVTGVS